MALTQTSVLLVLCAAAAFMQAPAAGQSQPPSVTRCQSTVESVTNCTLKILNPTAPTTPECCKIIKDAAAGEMDCMCGVYIGLKMYINGTANTFDSTVKGCGVTTNYSSACAEFEKTLKDGGFLENGPGNTTGSGNNTGSGSNTTGSGSNTTGSGNNNVGSPKETGTAGKTASAGVFGFLLVTGLTMLMFY